MSKKSATHKENVEDLQTKIQELTHALQHERADAINLRRRHAEEISNLRTHLKANVINDLLPVIDNFERALRHVPKNLEGNDYIKGVQGIINQFEKTLGEMGVERIKTVGQFNPELHEAVSVELSDGEHDEIVEELQAGYRIGDRVIRHAKVKVRQG